MKARTEAGDHRCPGMIPTFLAGCHYSSPLSVRSLNDSKATIPVAITTHASNTIITTSAVLITVMPPAVGSTRR